LGIGNCLSHIALGKRIVMIWERIGEARENSYYLFSGQGGGKKKKRRRENAAAPPLLAKGRTTLFSPFSPLRERGKKKGADYFYQDFSGQGGGGGGVAFLWGVVEEKGLIEVFFFSIPYLIFNEGKGRRRKEDETLENETSTCISTEKKKEERITTSKVNLYSYSTYEQLMDMGGGKKK